MIKKFFAESQQDEYIRNTFFPDYNKLGVVIEVGAATPEFISMSRHFKINNWKTIVVEPNPIFANQHRMMGNEIYEYACSFEDKDNVDFTVVHQEGQNNITDHSFSSFYIKDEYVTGIQNFLDTLPKTIIKVKQRTLDYILKEANIQNIDFLSVDVEGWEIEVMKGLTTIKAKVVVLENIFNNPEYKKYMESVGYKFVEHRHLDDIYVY
jgi:FkbM family methyltransferase